MINKHASKWTGGAVVDIQTAGGRRVMIAAHVFDRPNASFDGDGFVLFMPQYWYNKQPNNPAPWLRESWEVNAKVEPDGDGFTFDGPTGRGTVWPYDINKGPDTNERDAMKAFRDDLQAAGTSLPEEWARIDRDELSR